MDREEMLQLERAIEEIMVIAHDFGLDHFPMHYEVCPADIIYTFGAYGMPTRFSHWSFGKTFHRMKTQYDFGLSKIYELVINSNPCYAFLLDGNSLIQNKLIVAHVLAHCDFFKNNVRFSRTNRSMVESMAATAERVRKYEMEYGTDEVEAFLDAVLAVQEHVDPSIVKPPRFEQQKLRDAKHRGRDAGHRNGDAQQKSSDAGHRNGDAQQRSGPGRSAASAGGYDDLWELDDIAAGKVASSKEPQAFPAEPEKDLLWFIEQYSPNLDDWQRDILTMLRDEMLYFWPQLETKIMNEGWASYWHLRIVRELDLTSEETIEFAKLNSSVVQPSRNSLNPYYLGLKIFEDIESRYDRSRIFEVREYDSDTSFIRNYMTKDLVEKLDLYVFEKKGIEWKITDKSWENIRDQLVYSRVNGGFPHLSIENGDYMRNGEMYIKHSYEAIELDLKYLEKTLPYLHQLWGKTVHLETIIEDKKVVFTFDGRKHHRRFL